MGLMGRRRNLLLACGSFVLVYLDRLGLFWCNTCFICLIFILREVGEVYKGTVIHVNSIAHLPECRDMFDAKPYSATSPESTEIGQGQKLGGYGLWYSLSLPNFVRMS